MSGPHLPPDALDPTVDAITNSTMQEIAKSLLRQGCLGGLGDSRVLRATVREVVSRNVRKMVDLRLTGEDTL
jgi:hypothetical protein